MKTSAEKPPEPTDPAQLPATFAAAVGAPAELRSPEVAQPNARHTIIATANSGYLIASPLVSPAWLLEARSRRLTNQTLSGQVDDELGSGICTPEKNGG